MSRRLLVSTAALAASVAAAISVTLLAQAPAAGQTRSFPTKATTAGKAWTPPRTSDGKPDLRGIWTDNTLTPFERPKKLGAKEFYTDEEFADLTRRVRQGEVVEEADLGAGGGLSPGRTFRRRGRCRRRERRWLSICSSLLHLRPLPVQLF